MESMSPPEPLLVDCGPHGQRVAATVCQHLLLVDPAPVGFVENSDDPNDLQAWCGLCEEAFQQEGGLTDAFRAFTGMALVCVVCSRRLRRGIRRGPARGQAVRPGSGFLEPGSPRASLKRPPDLTTRWSTIPSSAHEAQQGERP